LNNPAGRLLYWLELGDQRQKQQSAMAEWCAVFGLDSSVPADRAECTRRGTMLAGLARSVRREAEQLDEMFHPAVMLEHFHEVESALDQFTILPSIGLEQMYAQMKGTASSSDAEQDVEPTSQTSRQRRRRRRHLGFPRTVWIGIRVTPPHRAQGVLRADRWQPVLGRTSLCLVAAVLMR